LREGSNEFEEVAIPLWIGGQGAREICRVGLVARAKVIGHGRRLCYENDSDGFCYVKCSVKGMYLARLPPEAVRGSASGRPIMVLLDVLGRRWALRVLWELRDGALTFRALQDRCDEVSPTVLNTRLKDLRALSLVAQTPAGYAYTRWGRELAEQMAELHRWSDVWAHGRDEAP
jgi:DNA-binding HxlR family transcriptional regulator